MINGVVVYHYDITFKTQSQSIQNSVIARTIFQFFGQTMKLYRPKILKAMNKLTAKDCASIETSIARERLRQARHSFNAALTATALSTCISLIGTGRLLLGKVSEGTATTLGCVVSCAGCIRLAKDANDRLDKIAQEIMDDI